LAGQVGRVDIVDGRGGATQFLPRPYFRRKVIE
jgi:hypothetical protein